MSNISSWFQKKPKRLHSSTSDESDASVPVSPACERPEKKRINISVTESGSSDMAFQEAISDIGKKLELAVASINKKLETLSTKADVEEIRGEVKSLRDTFKEKIERIEGRLLDIECKAEKIETESKQAKKSSDSAKDTVKRLDYRVQQCEAEQNDLQQYSRRWNLRVFRVQEQKNETADDCVEKVVRIFTDSVGVKTTREDIEAGHRTGQRSGAQARPVLVRFFDRRKRDEILRNRRKLKNKGVVIGEDLTYTNYQLLKRAMGHSATMSAWSANGKIFAKVKNGRVVKLSIHTDLDDAFRRALKPGDMSADEDDSVRR